jgi:hypothetical protein
MMAIFEIIPEMQALVKGYAIFDCSLVLSCFRSFVRCKV